MKKILKRIVRCYRFNMVAYGRYVWESMIDPVEKDLIQFYSGAFYNERRNKQKAIIIFEVIGMFGEDINLKCPLCQNSNFQYRPANKTLQCNLCGAVRC